MAIPSSFGGMGNPSSSFGGMGWAMDPLLGGWEIIGFYWFFGFFGGLLVVFGPKTMVINKNHGY